ncbi:MAG: DUF4838 domain-containing protein, partial [Armatimonadia bacterium]|nr:DUF4838 domain-containing protein [Armatimonadia bacterium]
MLRHRTNCRLTGLREAPERRDMTMTRPYHLLIVCLCAASVGAETETAVLVRDSQPAATVVLPADAAPELAEAASELSGYVEKLCGVALPVRPHGETVDGTGIYLGQCAPSLPSDPPRAKRDLESARREAFAIRMRDGNVFLRGRTTVATCYAVYAFIEEELGVRWFAPGDLWQHVPECEPGHLEVDVEERTVVPDIPLRIWSGHAWFASWRDWDRRNRASSGTRPIRDRAGNQLQGAFPVEVYGETHPEYYPLIRGQRFIPPPGPLRREDRFWPCSSNPEVVRVAADFIRRWFDEDPVNRRSFSMGMDDVTRICECDACRALDPPGAFETSNFSNRNYAFVNAVAREVKKTHSKRYIGVLVYRQLRRPPTNIESMEDNVYGFITQECGTWWSPGAENADRQLTRKWARLFQLPMVRYEYYGLGTFTPRYYPHMIDRQIKFDHRQGFEGNYTELYTFLP